MSRDRETVVLFKQWEFGNNNWIYREDYVCCIPAEYSDMSTVLSSVFSTNLTQEENHACEHSNYMTTIAAKLNAWQN